MALDEYQQAHTHLGNSKNILIIAGEQDIEDTYPASVALARVLRQNKKEATLFTPCEIPEHFYFLGDEASPRQTINSAQDLIISVDVSQKSVEQISYDRSDSRLDIHITPSPGIRMEEQDVHISLSKFNYDSIITIGIDDLESLENEFERNASLFYETSIINIDKNPSNERFGEVNIIEPSCSSCSEITTILLKKWDENLITKDVATPLLAGIIGATANFQNSRTKPNALHEAAYLMSCEADQQEIIKNLFKTKSFEFLKLWGIAMAKLRYIKDARLMWIIITKEDFSESGANAKQIPPILTELKNNFSQANLFIIFWENLPGRAGHSSYFGIIHAAYEQQLKPLSEAIRNTLPAAKQEKRGNNIVFTLPSKDASEQEKIISAISSALGKNKIS